MQITGGASAAPSDITVRENSIYANSNLGINLTSTGSTTPNNAQVAPTIYNTHIDASGNLVVTYSVGTSSGYPLTVDFYKADSNGQGKTWLTSDFWTSTDAANGQKTISLGNAATLGVTKGNALVATATDSGGDTSEFSAAQSNYTTFLVTNTADSGIGSLRQALTDANAQSGTDSIAFRIPTGDANYQSATTSWTITPVSALPNITDAVILDGTSQPGYGSHPVIELDGASAGSGTNGLTVTAANSTIEGLAINRFGKYGIDLSGTSATGNTIVGDFVGTDVTGMTALANGANGLQIDASANTIGGLTGATRNVISGNGGDGIFGGSSDLIEGNYIGVNAAGTGNLGNATLGIRISGGTNNTIGGAATGAGNVLSGGNGAGIALWNSADDNLVEGNYIGPNASGNATVGSVIGVDIENAGGHNTIGGTTTGAGNIISGNSLEGIVFLNTSGGLVQGNLIGLGANGSALANSADGIQIRNSSSGVTVGGTTAAARNVISGNGGSGINLFNSASGNLIEGNYIGTNAAGTSAVGNSGLGILINSATGTTVGGTTSAAANLISGNNSYGLGAEGTTTGTILENNYVGTDAGGSGTLLNAYEALLINTSNTAVQLAGSLTGNVLNFGSLSTANGPAAVTITGTYTQGSTGVLNVQLAGSNSYDQFAVSGTATLAGTLNESLSGGFVPGPTQSFTVVRANTISGSFGTVNSPTYGGRALLSTQYTSTAVVLHGNAIVVNSTGDSASQGGGSPDTGNTVGGQPEITLRSAIQAADALSGTVYIDFDIPSSDGGYNSGTGSWTIAPHSVLPSITASVVLDATTQPGYSTSPLIELRGDSAGTAVNALTITSSGTTIKGLDINRFNGDGIQLSGAGATGDLIEGNYIGTNAAGIATLSNAVDGLYINGGSSGNTVSGNVISGNTANGVEINGSGTSGNVVQSNYVGTNAAGTAALGNGTYGVYLHGGASGNTINGNAHRAPTATSPTPRRPTSTSLIAAPITTSSKAT